MLHNPSYCVFLMCSLDLGIMTFWRSRHPNRSFIAWRGLGIALKPIHLYTKGLVEISRIFCCRGSIVVLYVEHSISSFSLFALDCGVLYLFDYSVMAILRLPQFKFVRMDHALKVYHCFRYISVIVGHCQSLSIAIIITYILMPISGHADLAHVTILHCPFRS